MVGHEIPRSSPEYPEMLTRLSSPPKRLWSMGRPIPLHTPRVAIVGARKCTPYGAMAAKLLARGLVDRGVCVVSGMARGIDAAAHWGALEALGGWRGEGPPTIAVLGCGVDVVYPPSNQRLYMAMVDDAAIISEFDTGYPAMPQNFPARNRIIAALSLGVVVVEAAPGSGAFHTVDFALELGIEVMALPGNVFSGQSSGCHQLIKNGAALVEHVDDILEVLGEPLLEVSDSPEPALTVEESSLLSNLESGVDTLDDLVNSLKLDVGAVLTTLTGLELAGRVCRLPGGRWSPGRLSKRGKGI